MMVQVDFPVKVPESYMNPASANILEGHACYIELWGNTVTFSGMFNGFQFCDLPLAAMGCILYKDRPLPDERPVHFRPPNDWAIIFDETSKEPIDQAQVVLGLVWEKANVLLYLVCGKETGTVRLWPLHKMQFRYCPVVSLERAVITLPDWKKLR
jgi:hypothetical protein